MFGRVFSAVLEGIDSRIIQVEADVSSGLPYFDMVGYLSCEVREARERVRTAIRNSGCRLEARKIVVNLSPADIRKSGSLYDLAIAAAVLSAYGVLPQNALEETLIIGELSLNGEVRSIRGALPILLMMKRLGIRRCILPAENAFEGAQIPEVETYGVSTLQEMIGFLTGKCALKPVSEAEQIPSPQGIGIDFSDIIGQESLRRSMEVAAAGMHNVLMIGPPGAGNSMAARRVPTILPPLDEEESMEVSEIYSVSGLLSPSEGLIRQRPFRNPHHTITPAALIGGGRNPEPGEISLAHNGVLFLDEMTLFNEGTLELLRQPMDDGKILISRSTGSLTFPAQFMLIAAMNPCRCGYYPDRSQCRCTPLQIRRYLDRISRPLLDRIDITVEAQRVDPDEIISYDTSKGGHEPESSAQIRERVMQAHAIQKKRFEGRSYHYNSKISDSDINEFCRLGVRESTLMNILYNRFNLSARSYRKVLKVARTIADLDGSPDIREKHLSEAAFYKSIDNKYYGGMDGEL